MAEAPAIRNSEPASCTAMLTQLKARFGDQILLSANAADGWAVCNSAGIAPRSVRNGERSSHQLPLQAGGFAVGVWEPGNGPRSSGLHLGLPIQTEGGVGFAGTVTAAVEVARLAETLRSLPLPPGAELILVDRNDRVVLRLGGGSSGDLKPGDAAPPALMNLLPALPAAGVDADTETARLVQAANERGTARLVALAPYVPGTDGALRLAVSYDPASLPSPPAATAGGFDSKTGMALSLGGLALALIIAFVGARAMLSRPLAQALASAAAGAGRAPLPAETIGGTAQPAAAGGRDGDEALLALALETGNLGAWQLDPATGDLNRSEGFDAIFGYGRPVERWTWRGFLRHILPEDRTAAKEAFRRLRAGPGSVTEEVRIYRDGDGDLRTLHLRAMHQSAPDGTTRAPVRCAGRCHRRGHDGGGDAGRPTGARPPPCASDNRRRGAAPPVARRAGPPRPRHARHRAGHRRRNPAGPARNRRPDPRRRQDRLRGPPDRPRPLARGADARGRGQGGFVRTGQFGPRPPRRPPGGSGPRHTASGPALRLPAETAMPLSVALHELATNAARHGALSQPQGSVAVSWRMEEAGPGGEPMLRLRWEERGGPQLEGTPRRRGFGLKLLETGLAREIGGLVSVEFRPTGLVCDIEAPLRAAFPAETETV